MENIRISVCMATYNGAKYIYEQIFSILKQLNANDELIITDDNSKDNTIEIINSFNDSRIKLYQNEKQLGYTKNFEKAISLSNGEYIILSDQDDVWMDNKVEITMHYLQDEDYDFFYSDATITDEQLHPLIKSHNEDLNVKNGFVSNFVRCRFLGCCESFKVKIKKKLLPFPQNRTFATHDYWIALIAEMYYKCKVVNLPLMYYRRHGNTTSGGGYGKGLPLLQRLLCRIYMLFNLIIRIRK